MSRRRPIWALDAETDPFKKGRSDIRPFIWGLYEGAKEEYHEFLTTESLVNFLNSEYASKEKPIVYAHNGGKFDYHFLKEAINSDEPVMVINGRLAKFRIGDVECRDSLNILPVALKTFAKDEIDYRIMEEGERNKPGNWETIRKYLRSDCINLYLFVDRYQREYGKGLTQAGASMRYWSKKFNVEPPRQTVANFELLRPFYYGGRVQCFEQGYREERVRVVDINSSYPYALKRKHPMSTVPIRDDVLPGDEDQLGATLIRLDAIAKGCFPLRDEKGGLFFPDDERSVREYCITGWEFLAGLKYDALKVIRIKDVYTFGELMDFAPYIDHFYNLRKQAKLANDVAMDIFAKLFMNSLYGKFASDCSKYKEWLITSLEGLERWVREGYERQAMWGDRYVMARPVPEYKHRYYNIATSASVTGFARAYLFEGLMKVSGAVYCDTDSITARDVSSLPVGPELGQWKDELEGDAWAMGGKKLYGIRDIRTDWDPKDAEKKGMVADRSGRYWKIACKGVDLQPDEIVEVSQGKRILHEPEVPTFSIRKEFPYLQNRNISNTARDIRIFPD